MFDAIEKLKSDFTDKYVVVDAGRPELARFAGLTGQVKTVNMSGKALVQFEGRNNIGWYDIGLDFLKIVPKPEPKADDDKHGKKAAPAAKAPAPKAAEAKPAAAAGEKKPSVLEMLKAQAAAKTTGGAAPAAPAPSEAKAAATPAPAPAAAPAPPAAAKPAEAAPAAEAPAGEKKKLSTAEILAALKKKA